MIWSMAQAAWPRARFCPSVRRPRTCGHDAGARMMQPRADGPTRITAPNRRRTRTSRRAQQISDPGSVQQLQSVILADVTSAVGTSGTAITSRVHSLNRPNMVSVGTIVWLSSELMFFAGLFAIYFTARAQAGGKWPPPPTELNLYQAVPVTLVSDRLVVHLPDGRVRRRARRRLRAAPLVCDHVLDGPVLRPRPGLRVLPPGDATAPRSRAAPTAPSSIWRPVSTGYTSPAA